MIIIFVGMQVLSDRLVEVKEMVSKPLMRHAVEHIQVKDRTGKRVALEQKLAKFDRSS